MFEKTGFFKPLLLFLIRKSVTRNVQRTRFFRPFIALPSLLLRSSFALPSLQGWDKNTGIGGIMVE